MSMRRTNLAAVALSALFHGLLGLATWNAALFKPAEAATEPQRETVEVSLAPETAPDGAAPAGTAAAIAEAARPPDQPEEKMPDAYTDVPERMRGEKPDRADYLALVNSRAADLVPGGEKNARPAAPEESEVDQVAIRRQQDGGAQNPMLPSAGGGLRGATPPAPPTPADAGTAAPARGPSQASGDDALFATGQPEPGSPGDLLAGRGGDRQGQPAPARTEPEGLRQGPAGQGDNAALDDLFGGQGLTLFRRSQSGGAGDSGFDFDQPAMGKPGGNAFIYGDYALNTYAWNFAPWLQKFGQDLRRNWYAPYAYMIGVINGKTEMKVVIERDGRLSSLEVRNAEGHVSLQQASEAAVRAAAPYSPLPPDFPEPNLVIILTLYYPPWKTETPAESAPSPATGQGRGHRGGR